MAPSLPPSWLWFYVRSGQQSCRPTGITSRRLGGTRRPGSSCALRLSLGGLAATETCSSFTESWPRSRNVIARRHEKRALLQPKPAGGQVKVTINQQVSSFSTDGEAVNVSFQTQEDFKRLSLLIKCWGSIGSFTSVGSAALQFRMFQRSTAGLCAVPLLGDVEDRSSSSPRHDFVCTAHAGRSCLLASGNWTGRFCRRLWIPSCLRHVLIYYDKEWTVEPFTGHQMLNFPSGLRTHAFVPTPQMPHCFVLLTLSSTLCFPVNWL